MKWWIGSLLCAMTAFSSAANDELPSHEGEEAGEIDPPLLIEARARDGSIPDLPPTASGPESVDIAKLQRDLERAKKRAAGAERLFKAGIIAKVEAEQRALKVVQLEAAIAQARFDAAKATADQNGDVPAQTLAEIEADAKRALEERQQAELEAAIRNLQRQQKLLALGSGRKADVSRAEEKLAELQQPKQ